MSYFLAIGGAVFWFAVAVALLFAGFEFIYRRSGARILPSPVKPFAPFLMLGDLLKARSHAEIENASGGPGKHGLEYRRGIYLWDGRDESKMADLTAYLFEHLYSRRTLAEVDSIPDADFRIMILGASVAQGAAASGPNATWHFILENSLRHLLGRQDVHVVNCAMGSFVTVQERLAFDLAVAPRKPDVVIVMNGSNHLGTLQTATPGHLYSGACFHFAQTWRPSLLATLGEHSMLARDLYQARTRLLIAERATSLLADPATRERAACGVAGVYAENMTYLIERCLQIGAKPFVMMHPWKGLCDHKAGRAVSEVLPNWHAFEMRVYDEILARMQSAGGGEHFFDLTDLFVQEPENSYLVDPVHPDDRGQVLLAERVLRIVYPTIKIALLEKSVAAETRSAAFK